LVDKHPEIEFLPGTKISQIPVPHPFIGRNIKELTIRGRFGVEILVIIRDEDGKQQQSIPYSDYYFTVHDKLVIMDGEKEVHSLQNL
jgi:K+/H+ antiporter YhaU regulatory subunit KhtT